MREKRLAVSEIHGCYKREVGSVKSAGPSRDAWTYVCGRELRFRLDGDRNPDEFRQRELDWYVKRIVQT